MLRSSVCIALLAAGAAEAQAFSLRADGSAVIPLGEPQSRYFLTGGSLSLTGMYALAPVLDLGVQLGAALLPPADDAPVSLGSTFWIGPALRLRRKREDSLIVPWLEAGVHFNQTGMLPRASLGAAAGLLFRFSEDSTFFFGPHLKYLRIFGIDTVANTLTVDANLVMVGLTLEFTGAVPRRDRDGDGLVDGEDTCPTEAGLRPSGCPVSDLDDDGVNDADDACRTEAGLLILKGCPDRDEDYDGIKDRFDGCPDRAEDQDGFEDVDGCPEPDNDKDGVYDLQDRCPLTPGPERTQGCPDTDVDGIPDALDQCPNAPGGAEDGGCPVYKQVVVTEQKIEIKQKIFFAFGNANILQKSFGLLDEVVMALQDRPALCVRVEGHTDSMGKASANLKLSEARAASVRKYVVDRGVAPARLKSGGSGAEQALESNKTSEGRERNRRVEFVIIPCGGDGK